MENKQSQNPSKSGSSNVSGGDMSKKSSSKIGSDEFDLETKHSSSSETDSDTLSGGGDKGSCSSGCGTGVKQ